MIVPFYVVQAARLSRRILLRREGPWAKASEMAGIPSIMRCVIVDTGFPHRYNTALRAPTYGANACRKKPVELRKPRT